MFRYDFDPDFHSNFFLSNVGALQREINKLFASMAGHRASKEYPLVNVWTSEDGIKLIAELPGINPEKFSVEVRDDTLMLSGEHEPESLNEGEVLHRRERREGKFSRTFNLPFKVEQKDVTATYKNGVLTVTLPIRTADKPQKIEIKAA